MLVRDRILLLRSRVKEQQEWITKCGEDLAGYVAIYGDPDVPPLKDGKPQTFHISDNQLELVSAHLKPVPGTTNEFFARHSGNGGTKIYEADADRLHIWEEELKELSRNNPDALREANMKSQATDLYVECWREIVPNLEPLVNVFTARYNTLNREDIRSAFIRAVEELVKQ